MPVNTVKKGLKFGDEAKKALSKLSAAELASVLEDMPMADNNNANNFAQPGQTMSKEDMVKAVSQLPEGQLKTILKNHGIIQ